MTRPMCVETLVARIIRGLHEEDERFPATRGWQVGAMPDGLPLLAAELAAAGPDDAMDVLKRLGEHRKWRLLDVDDPARIAVVFTWPEPEHGQPRPQPEAVVQLWAPAAAEVRAA
ncbi:MULTISPECIES: hypothetical protein [Streptomyces]|uniref:Uncharacterized protein n=2 Tax=Streptomyces rimosus subsp. rimosus TaxID=132474 RepID=A0A8A1UNR8_STRR1|nr:MULTISPECIES: hypothetical protein [Streptomyces]MYT47353.1 hypothetical protein [Streptomyces sp. SID5471]QGY64803.1 hypothetical protein V519_001825 [Streptomyces rimosus R6-500]QST81737.1 hypothetical protein SRIM_017610 [Streptomyces rimosus subsp. rimosus ATCC 10970]QTL88355.1 hypothetical protein FMM49_23780 [Streptomyces rimosus subsp. rimosus]